MSTRIKQYSVVIALIATSFTSQSAPLDLTGQTYVTYGDGNSYSLSVNSVISGISLDVNSTPGQIQDLIVVATGSSGGPVNTNVAGMDDALSTPSGVSGSNYFQGTWNSTLEAFKGFIGTDNPLFFFNNNQVNSGGSTNQNLAAWAQVSLTGAGQPTLYFDFTNNLSPYALFTEGGGGVFMGDVSAYTSSGSGPVAGTNASTDYILSGGAICLTATNVPVSCSSAGAVTGPINNNLGADNAAYAIDAPELNAFLAAWTPGSLYTDLHIEMHLGCDPNTVGTQGGSAGVGDCVGRDINNGYEQLFIGTSPGGRTEVPSPGTLVLVVLGLFSLGASRRGKRLN